MKDVGTEYDPRVFSFAVAEQSASGNLYWTLTLCAPPAAGKPLHKVVHSACAAEEVEVDRLSISQAVFRHLFRLLCHGFCVPGVGLQDFLRTDDGQVVFTGAHKAVPVGTCIPPRSTSTAAVSHDFSASSLCHPSDSEWMTQSPEAILAHQAGQLFVASQWEATWGASMVCAEVVLGRCPLPTRGGYSPTEYAWVNRILRDTHESFSLETKEGTLLSDPAGPLCSALREGLAWDPAQRSIDSLREFLERSESK
ncbi:unnamed protein product [Symbiodinium sp. KB8]|nr:unnamed protein product [Symbiodinium sp. KB8]